MEEIFSTWGEAAMTAVAFMFASTNLVIELGVLILIFLGWQFLAAEIIGGLLLIAISTVLIRLTYPKSWMRTRLRGRTGTGHNVRPWLVCGGVDRGIS